VSKKPSPIANLILALFVLVPLAGLGFGGIWVYKKFFGAEGASPGPEHVEKVEKTTSPDKDNSVQGEIEIVGGGKPGGGLKPLPSAGNPDVPIVPEPVIGELPTIPPDPDPVLAVVETPVPVVPEPAPDVPIVPEPVVEELPATPSPSDPDPAPADPEPVSSVPPELVPEPVDLEGPPVPRAAEVSEEFTMFDESSAEATALKDDAERRIDEAPSDRYSERDKRRVRAGIRGASQIAKICTVYFGVGSSTLDKAEQSRLAEAMVGSEVKSLSGNPRAVFFTLGFADRSGAASLNKKLSMKRSQQVVDLLKDKHQTENLVYPVAIGSTELISEANQGKNRAVEVWLLLP